MGSMLLRQRYHLAAPLGQGGMGTVYAGYDTVLDRAVAIKVLNPNWLTAEGRARLLAEARAAAQLNHPHIVNVYDAGETAEGAFIVMEYVEGESLYERWPLPLDEVLRVSQQVCAALHHAHTHGIIHRDLKLENVLLTADGQAKLSDFGLARSLSSRLTSDSSLTGTVYYLAPEAALGQPLDGRADLYALGVLLYELTTGKLPFTGDDPLTIVSQHLYAPPVPPRAHVPGLPPALDALIVRLLSKDPADRPASAAEVAAALERIAAGEVAAPTAPLSPLEVIARGRMVGRAQEAAETRAHWQRAVAGQGQTILVSGEPGIGKTRLLRELAALAEISGGQVLWGECYAEGGPPYAPIGRILRALAAPPHSLPPLPPAIQADLVTLGLPAHSVPAATPNPPLDPTAEQWRVFESAVELLAALAAVRPILLVIDDAHWADSGTLWLIRHLARRLRAHRVLLALTYREVELDQRAPLREVILDLTRERLAQRLKLHRLTPDQTADLLAQMFQDTLPADFLAALYAETEGNPFFIEEVCKALIENGQLQWQAGRWQVGDIHAVEVPQSVRLAVQARLNNLPPATQEVLNMAAVLGRQFDFDTLTRALPDHTEEALLTALESAERAQLIGETARARPGLSATTFTFAHALIPATLRDGLSRLRRQRLHARALTALQVTAPTDYERLAYHAERAGQGEPAWGYYLQAGNRALTLFASQEAERHYRAALEIITDVQATLTADRPRAQASLAEALFRQSRFDEAAGLWLAAAQGYLALSNPDEAARCFARQGRALWHLSPTEALAACRQAMQCLPAPLTDGPGAAALLHETGRACFFAQEHAEASALCQRALAMAERLRLTDVQADTLATMGILPNHPAVQRRAWLEQAAAMAEQANLLEIANRAYINLGSNLRHEAGDLPASIRAFTEAARLARRLGGSAWAISGQVALCDLLTLAGDLPAAHAHLQDIEAALATLANPPMFYRYYALLSRFIVWYRQGEAERALTLAQTELSHLPADHDLRVDIQANVLLMLAYARWEMAGDAASAIEQATTAWRLTEQHSGGWPGVAVFLACMHSLNHDWPQAQTHLDWLDKQTLGPVDAAMRQFAHWVHRLTSAGWDMAAPQADGWRAALEQVGARWALAAYLLMVGRYLRQHQHPQAGPMLAEARALFQAMPAPGFVTRINALLAEA